jgi:hypothetical protein
MGREFDGAAALRVSGPAPSERNFRTDREEYPLQDKEHAVRRPHGAAKRRPPRQAKPDRDRTKFDIWLDRCCQDRTPLTFNFAIPPVQQFGAQQGVGIVECYVIGVDRYMIQLEFPDGQTWWVNKSIITAVALTEAE